MMHNDLIITEKQAVLIIEKRSTENVAIDEAIQTHRFEMSDRVANGMLREFLRK
jgi:hypothetical protein